MLCYLGYIQCIVISDLQWVICGALTIHGRMCWLNVQWIWTMVKPHGIYSDDNKLRSMVVAWGNYCIYCPVVVILLSSAENCKLISYNNVITTYNYS